VGAADVIEKSSVLEAAFALGTVPPSIVAAGRHAEHGTDPANGPEMAMLIDEPERHREPFPKMSAAFFRMST
jgi:hypothetical protein